MILKQEPDLLILDIGMPYQNGFEFSKMLRAEGYETSIIFMTAKDTIEDKLQGFTIGADDYICKPFNYQELVARVRVITRSDSGQFEVKQQEVNLRVLVRQVVGSLQIQARKAEVVLHADIPPPEPLLFIDPQRMKQVLNNLVINAIKFTPPGGTVTIRTLPYNERFVMITVADTGSGIPVEDRPHVFERFYQSNHSSQSKVGGYGLGLTIAKLIVEQHGGSIDFDTVLGKGTTFYFTAPVYMK